MKNYSIVFKDSLYINYALTKIHSLWLKINRLKRFLFFYTKLKKRRDEKRAIEEQEHAAYCLEEYKNNELFAIVENIDLRNVSDVIDFEMEFSNTKQKLDWHEHYYPTAVHKEDSEIFEDLITYGFIFKCEKCNKYFNSCKRDDEYITLCDGCGAEQYDLENADA